MLKLPFMVLAPLLLTAVSSQAQSNSARAPHPIAVRLLPPSPQTREPLRYVVSEPAYVAVFVVYPGAGIRLLYPEAGLSRPQYAGYHSENLIGARFDNDIYNVVLGPGTGGPEYLYIIASKYPLDMERFVHRPARLALAVGYKAARSFDGDVAIDALLDHVVSLGGDDSWDSDVYMLWPGQPRSLASQSASAFRDIQCASGLVMRVPEFYPFLGCPGESRVRISLPRNTVQAQTLANARPAERPLEQASRIEAPTVLPTIIGVRRASAKNADAVASSIPYPTTITAAGSVTAIVAGQSEPVVVQAPAAVPVFVEVPVFVGERRGERHSRAQDESYDESRRGAARQQWGGPALAPSPRLAPTPTGSPAPGMAPSPSLPPSRRFEAPSRAEPSPVAHAAPAVERVQPPQAPQKVQ